MGIYASEMLLHEEGVSARRYIDAERAMLIASFLAVALTGSTLRVSHITLRKYLNWSLKSSRVIHRELYVRFFHHFVSSPFATLTYFHAIERRGQELLVWSRPCGQ